MTKAEKLKVIGAVTEMLIIGANDSEIKRFTKNSFSLSSMDTRKIINHVLDKWQSEGEQDMRIKRRRAIEARKKLIKAAWQTGNLDVVLRGEDSLAVVEGTRYNQKTDEDSEIVFQILMKKSAEDNAEISEFADDLENPDKFDQRCEKQLKKFVSKHGVVVPDGKHDEIKKA